MIRSAVFLPNPFTAQSRLESAVAIASESSAGRMDESTEMALFAPTPCTEVSFKNKFFSTISANPNSETPSSLTFK